MSVIWRYQQLLSAYVGREGLPGQTMKIRKCVQEKGKEKKIKNSANFDFVRPFENLKYTLISHLGQENLAIVCRIVSL